MKLRTRRIVSWAAIASAAVAYAILAHLSNANPNARDLGVVLAVAPLWLVAVGLAWRSRRRVPALGACLVALAAVIAAWPALRSHFAWLYLLQQGGAYALLAVTFGRSLRSGAIPLCSRWAALVHGALTPAIAAYTRKVTLAWTVFFAVIACALVVLFVAAPLPVWSAFANFVTPALVVLMFAGEYCIRLRSLPQVKHASVLDGVRAYLATADAVAAPRV